MMIMIAIFSITVMADGPPLKDNICELCHKDYNTIRPKTHPDVVKEAGCISCLASDPANKEATKFSTLVHKVHKGEKTTQDCSACHALLASLDRVVIPD